MQSARRLFGKLMPIELPAEFANEQTLLAKLEISSAELKKVWWYRNDMYSRFNISKKSGKERLIAAPDKRLKILQGRINPILTRLYKVRSPVHGFVVGKSVKTNALAHRNRRFVLNIDFKDFFETISEKRVVGLLRSLGIDRRVAEILARICCVDGHLPQGASTSPILSNMICYRLDTELQQLAKSARAIYTRYADDLTFSGYQPLAPLFEPAAPPSGRISIDLLSENLKATIKRNGFTVHPEKAHYADRNSRRMVTGVKINEGLNVDRRYVRKIRAVLHSVEVFGLKDAELQYTLLGGRGSLINHLRGKISYLTYLKSPADPVVRSLVKRYNKCFPKRQIQLEPSGDEKRDRSVWVVENIEEYGSAFFLSGYGLVTAAHCVKDADEVDVIHPARHTTKFKAKVLHYDKNRDLAILDHALVPSTEYFELAPAVEPAAIGSAVTALGYPDWGLGERFNVRPGSVSSLTARSGLQLIEVTQQLSQGMSGGPILNAAGEVVGIVHKGGPEEGRQFAIRISELRISLENR